MIFVVLEQVALLAIFHEDFEALIAFVELVLVDADEVGVNEFSHNFYFPEGLLNFEGVDVDLLKGVAAVFVVLN